MLIEILLSAITDAAVQSTANIVKSRLSDKAARKELAEVCASSIERAAEVVPSLADDLRSATFIEGVIGPTVLTIIEDPSQLPNPKALSERFMAIFVARYAERSDFDTALTKVFQTNPDELRAAFQTFIDALRSALLKSARWREVATANATFETLAIGNRLEALLTASEARTREATIDLAAARRDAVEGSSELRSWPTDIGGQKLARPLLERLLARIETTPGGVSLVIGQAGSGKSALLAELTAALEAKGITTFGIKADTLPSGIRTINDIGIALGMAGLIEAELGALATAGPLVLLVDQLDAVSTVMDRHSHRMRLLLRLVQQTQAWQRKVRSAPSLHVIVSSRPFEAAHDARFRQLGAEEFTLDLPSIEQVKECLTALGLDAEHVEGNLLETLRRPFALKLYYEIAIRGGNILNLASAQLLDRWLATADLGDEQQRGASLHFMTLLAEQMILTETLWRPRDLWLAHHDALARCMAAGLVVESGLKVGFSHQSWLDDFQARGFVSGADLANYAWRNQGSLFVRAAVLRGLERLRLMDEAAYGVALDALLGEHKTRRHLKHLVVDMLSTQAAPTVREAAWAKRLAREDAVLAKRALGNISSRWPAWRAALSHDLAFMMTQAELHWHAAEAAIDPDSAVALIERHWDDPEHDRLSMRILEEAASVTDRVEKRLKLILSRSTIDDHSIAHFVTTLRVKGQLDSAVKTVRLWADRIPTEGEPRAELFELEKLAEAAPIEFAAAILPWFIDRASSKIEENRGIFDAYPRSLSLPYNWGWGWDHERGNVFECLRLALRQGATAEPERLRPLLADVMGVEIDQVKELVAEGLAANGEAFAEDGHRFFLADARRFRISCAHVQIEEGVGGMVYGYASQALVEAIAPHLSDDALTVLRDAIEAWSMYRRVDEEQSDPDTRRRKLRYADDERLALLERIPASIISPRRRRQVSEWRTANPRPLGNRSSFEAGWVGPPMTSDEMAKAGDKDILRLLNEVHDTTEREPFRRPLSRGGGVSELASAYAAFGKANPSRAMALARTHFKAGVNETAAGRLVSELARENDVGAGEVLALILDLTDRGFSSECWRHDAAFAMQSLAQRIDGLNDDIVQLLEGWIDSDPAAIADRVQRHRENELLNLERNKDKQPPPGAVLFDRHSGMRVLPGDNFTILSAMAAGILSRPDRNFDLWLAALERHAERPEEPQVWLGLLLFRGRWLFWADRNRVVALFRRLWANDPTIFRDIELASFLWPTREMLPEEVMTAILARWLASDDRRDQQGAAEFVQASLLVDGSSSRYGELLSDKDPTHIVGSLYSAASAWRADDPQLRRAAHIVLMAHAPTAEGEAAYAFARAVQHRGAIAEDKLTVEILKAIIAHDNLLLASLNHGFSEFLQKLLLAPGFDQIVLEVTEAVTAALTSGREGTRNGLVDQDFVQVSVALQRNDGKLRERAMNVYEKLLDAGVYGAEQAARAATAR